MKIGVLFRPDAVNAYYRAIGPAEALRAVGHDVTIVQQGEDYRFDIAPLRRCDVVHVYRRGDPSVLAAIDDLQRRGIAVTWDNDDDIRLMPAGSPLARRMSKLDIKKDFDWQKKALRRADLVTTTSPYLERTYRDLTDAPVRRIENYLMDAQYPRGSRSHDGIVVGWVAGFEHGADEQALGISGALARVLERQPGMRVESVGLRLDLPEDRYRHLGVLEFEELRDRIRQWDVGLAPLSDIPMSYARSSVKVKEYAGAGVSWLASARGPYEGLGETEGGMLVVDDGWEAAIDTLVRSRLKRWSLSRKARAWSKTQAVTRHVAEWAEAFEAAIEARSRAGAAQRGAARGAAAGRSA